MSTAAYQRVSWTDPQTLYISHLYTLYHRDFMINRQLCDMDYRGYPDPKYDDGSEVYKPDFLSFSPSGDAQHIRAHDFQKNGLDNSPIQDRIESRLQETSKYNSISSSAVSEYLSLHEEDFTPQVNEAVALVPEEIYNEHKEKIEPVAESNDVKIWLISTNGVAKIWKELGSHSNLDLDTELEEPYRSYPDGTDVLRFTRNSSENRLKFAFIKYLIKHCSRENMNTFTYEQIDDIMVSKRPPILGHITRSEREEHWQQFLYSMIHRFSLIEPNGNDEYAWKKSQFLKEPRYRQSILADIKGQLDLGGENT